MFFKGEQIQILLNTYDDLAHNDQGTFFAYLTSSHLKA